MYVGDIPFDPKTDDPAFQFCNPSEIYQGFQFRHPGDETSRLLGAEVKSRFKFNPDWKSESGFITIRFAVNCYGISDRFRVIQLSTDLSHVKFKESMIRHLTDLTKQTRWPVRSIQLRSVDYHHYVTYKIENGQLIEVNL